MTDLLAVHRRKGGHPEVDVAPVDPRCLCGPSCGIRRSAMLMSAMDFSAGLTMPDWMFFGGRHHLVGARRRSGSGHVRRARPGLDMDVGGPVGRWPG